MKKTFNLALVVAHANVIASLYTDLFSGVRNASRELVGAIPSVTRNSSAERAAVDQTVRVPYVGPKTAKNITPAMAIPEPRDTNTGHVELKITKSRAVEFGLTGEEAQAIRTGVGTVTLQSLEIQQAVRTLTNEIEDDICADLAVGASRAWGTAGTTPFATSLEEAANLRKILDDNGAPGFDRSLLINTTAGVKLRSLTQLTKVNEAGTTMTLRDGQLLDLFGMSVKESAGIASFAKGSAASATTNAAGYAVGATVITLASAGTGNIKPGDFITFAGDANMYQVLAGDADVSGGGTITIASPGLRLPIAASATNITLVANSVRNVAFSASAYQLVTRAPALPPGGDIADESYMITDSRSGLVFEVRHYKGYHKNLFEIGMAWGGKVINEEHVAVLLG